MAQKAQSMDRQYTGKKILKKLTRKTKSTGYTATATNRTTGKKTTKSGTLTPTTKSDFVGGATSGVGSRMKRVAKPRKKTY